MGCTTTQRESVGDWWQQQDCYLELGLGVWQESDGIVNDVPSDANLYCEDNGWTYGYFHFSDITRSKPFNDLEEISTNRWRVTKKIKIK